jgi:hypothetical protein
MCGVLNICAPRYYPEPLYASSNEFFMADYSCRRMRLGLNEEPAKGNAATYRV